MSDAEYWKARCKLAEVELERLQTERVTSDLPPAVSEENGWTAEERDRYYDNTGLRNDALEALRLLMAMREDGCENAKAVAARLIADGDERKRALNLARRAGYPVDDHPDVSWLFERLLADLNSGRSTINFLSRSRSG